EEDILVVSAGKAEQIRTAVPRGIAEWVAHHQALKKGTDAQVGPGNFERLLELYRNWALECQRMGSAFALFGHFGDAHLHFNFLASGAGEARRYQQALESFYPALQEMGGSP